MSIICGKCGRKHKRIFKEKESTASLQFRLKKRSNKKLFFR